MSDHVANQLSYPQEPTTNEDFSYLNYLDDMVMTSSEFALDRILADAPPPDSVEGNFREALLLAHSSAETTVDYVNWDGHLNDPASSNIAPTLQSFDKTPNDGNMLSDGLGLAEEEPDHAAVELGIAPFCAACYKQFKNNPSLRRHATITKHNPYACKCGKKFSRVDALRRHVQQFNDSSPRHPCPFCKKHRGENGFTRRDHLLQHIEGYHRVDAEEKRKALRVDSHAVHGYICDYCHQNDEEPHISPNTSTEQRQAAHGVFMKKRQFTKHMRDVHSETPFPCESAACDRVGAKGFAREADLDRHRTTAHPDEPQDEPAAESALQCPMIFCRSSGYEPKFLRSRRLLDIHQRWDCPESHWELQLACRTCKELLTSK